ncbi:MAG: polysaccharide biosynthesis protein [Phycisphaerae bacterium]|nr:polysaccharide biosynthesis protein [Phycisphaerae bacterium]
MSNVRETTRAMPQRGMLRHRGAISFLVHILLFALAFFCAWGLYYNFKNFGEWVQAFFLPLLPIALVIKMIVFTWMKLFRGSWRYVGMRDLMSLVKATHISTILFVAVFFSITWLRPDLLFDRPQFPQAVFLLDWGTTIGVVCGSRILVRLYYEEIRPVPSSGQTRCLIIGAGDTGEALLREILRMPVDRYRVVGFLDDDSSKHGSLIHGVPVLGHTDEARRMCKRHEVEEFLVAMPGLTQKRLRQIVEQSQGLNVRFRTIPAMEAVIEGRVTVSQIRDVQIKDLLGREQVELDEAKIKEYLHDERVLVTGAGGSIGSEMCRQILRYRPASLVLVEQAENNLFEIDRELAAVAPDIPRVCYIADICDANRVNRVFETERPAVVFHAAAHKHVPMMESNVGEAIKNNILGTKTVADAAKRHHVRRFVMISTDKAVNPTSVMGCTKRVAEMYIQQLRQGSSTKYMTVRFGNVLGSSGSVVPIFARQIATGGPVTVTDPNMTRFFMTIPEASQLVLQAGVMGEDGDIFVLDMGEPVKIIDLAREMITLSGLRPGEDIEIKISGVRPGEKLYEELSVKGEGMGRTTHKKIYVWRNRKEDWPRVCELMDELVTAADALPAEQLKRRLGEVVPEFSPQEQPSPASPISSAEAPIRAAGS